MKTIKERSATYRLERVANGRLSDTGPAIPIPTEEPESVLQSTLSVTRAVQYPGPHPHEPFPPLPLLDFV